MQLVDFYRFVQPSVPGCPDETMRVAIVNAVTRLCRGGHIWRELQDPIPLIEGISEYEPDYPPGARAINVESAFIGPRQLMAVTLNELSWRLPEWQTSRGGQPVFMVGGNDWGTVNLYPIPMDPRESLVMRVEYEPKIEAAVLPDFIMQRYQTQIVRGAKAELLMMPGVAWKDYDLAARLEAQFENDVVDAAIKMIHERNSANMRVRPIAFQ